MQISVSDKQTLMVQVDREHRVLCVRVRACLCTFVGAMPGACMCACMVL